jgi:SAM-dependent methyltransferase
MSTGATWSASFGSASLSAMQVYDELMVPRVFEPWAKLVVDLLAVAPGEAVLDVACGPGSVARVAAGRVGTAGRVTGCDLSPAMLAVGQAKPPVDGGAAITFLEAPADRLPVQDAAFDVVVCQQGLQFFPDRAAAVAEMLRALRPGGRLGVAVWTEIDRSPAWSAVADAIEEVAGAELAARYRGGPWGFPDGQRLAALLEDAGFQDVRISKHVLPVTFERGPAQVAATLAASGIAEQVGQLSSEERQRLVQTVASAIGSGSIDSEMESNIAIARR